MFMVVDGIDGSGKGTIVAWLKQALSEAGRRTADIGELCRGTGRFPGPEAWRDAAVVVTVEPTYLWCGAGIREELARDPAYDPLTVAEVFAADREIHFRKLIIPARAAGKRIISERGVSSSICYQVAAGVPEDVVLGLPGNRLALENAPDCLVLAEVDPATAVARLAARSGKDDGSYFERRPFLEKLADRYRDPAFRSIFESRGTRIVSLSTEGGLADTAARCREILLPLLT
jgi:dTMP kinase